MASGCVFQIFLRVTVQNKIGIAQWVIVDKVVQLSLLRHGNIQCILDPSAVDRDHSPIPEQQLHTAGVHVEMASSCIVLHVCVLSALRHSYSGLSCFLMIRSRTFFRWKQGIRFVFQRIQKIRTLLLSEKSSDFVVVVHLQGLEPWAH